MLGSADLVEGRQHLRRFPHPREERVAAAGLDGLDEPPSRRVLAELGLEPERPLNELRHALRALPARPEDGGEPLRAGHLAAPGPGHHVLAVAFEQAHQRLGLPQRGELLRGGEQPDETTLGEWVTTFPEIGRGAAQALEDRLHIGDTDGRAALDEPQEVLAHPGHPGELHPVRHLVEGDPEPELARREPVVALQRDDVRPDVVDESPGLVPVERHEVVLAEDLGRHPGEQHPKFDARRHPRRRREDRPTTGAPLAEGASRRREEPAQRSDVRLDPTGPVDNEPPGPTGGRVQPGRRLDELLGPRRRLVEIRVEPPAGPRVERLGEAGGLPSDPQRDVPRRKFRAAVVRRAHGARTP